MNTYRLLSGVTALVFAAAASAAPGSGITVSVTPSLAPNAYGSSYWGGYVSNAVNALYTGASTYGSPGDPAYYQAVTGPINVKDNIVTGFNSWLGDANPGTDFGANYANEYGNRLHFGVKIEGNGTQISISEMGFTAASDDPGDGLGFSYGPGSYTYSSDYMGVIHGPGGDTFITSGPATQLVDEIVGRGSGNAYAVYSTDPGATNQDKIDIAASQIAPYNFTGTYYLVDSNGTQIGSGNANVTAVPEPASMVILAAGGLGFLRRRKKA